MCGWIPVGVNTAARRPGNPVIIGHGVKTCVELRGSWPHPSCWISINAKRKSGHIDSTMRMHIHLRTHLCLCCIEDYARAGVCRLCSDTWVVRNKNACGVIS